MLASINQERLELLSTILMNMDTCMPTNWTYPGLPDVGENFVAEYFFTAVKHQYCFWQDDGTAYSAPMFGVVEGQKLKGSDFLWQALLRSARSEPRILNIHYQAGMSNQEIMQVFSDDNGICPLPMIESHCEIWRSCAKDFIRKSATPMSIIASCKNSENPIERLMSILVDFSGYKEDPFLKKAALLTLIFTNRPEQFLGNPASLTDVPPIVDYHNMRSALRIGLINIEDEKLEKKLITRSFISEEEEMSIREKTYHLLNLLTKLSNKSLDAIDWFFFQNRISCPEMTEPDCANCLIQSVCAQKKELFQPIIRTTYY